MPDKRIFNFQIPRTTPTNGLKKWLFPGVYEVRKGPPLWKLGKFDQLFEFLGKRWFFFGVKSVVSSSTLKMTKSKKNSTCIRIHTRVYANTWWWGQISQIEGNAKTTNAFTQALFIFNYYNCIVKLDIYQNGMETYFSTIIELIEELHRSINSSIALCVKTVGTFCCCILREKADYNHKWYLFSNCVD